MVFYILPIPCSPVHNALKFSVVFGTISSYNSIIIRPASTSLIEISKKHLFRTVFSGFFDFPILQEVDFSSRVFGLVSFLSLFRSEFQTSKLTNERAEDSTDSLLVTKRFTDSNRTEDSPNGGFDISFSIWPRSLIRFESSTMKFLF